MNPSFIEELIARKILDSRGNFTIEADVYTRLGLGRCSAPSGASTGKHEVVAFPQSGVEQALVEVEENIAPELVGMDAAFQNEVDTLLAEMDGTSNFSNIGGNTAVAISLANAKAASASFGLPLFQFLGGSLAGRIPLPLGNVIGGGAHARGATDIQEFLVVPVGAEDIVGALTANALVHRRVGELLRERYSSSFGRGDEGAWAPDIGDKEALDILADACGRVEDEFGVELRMGMDVAASELYSERKKKYLYPREGKERSTEEQISYMAGLAEEYRLIYIEDPLHEEDFEGFAQLTSQVKSLVCGDDLYVTSSERLAEGIGLNSTSAVLIKPNQCGTLTATYETVRLAKAEGMTSVISHRSGETADETIAHLAVGLDIPLIKAGVVGGERIAKLNELVRISEELEGRAKMAELPKL